MYSSLKVDYYSPPFGFETNEEENLKIIRAIYTSAAEILFLCVGTPKSEKWIYRNISHLKTHLAFVLGNSLNIFVGVRKRAPNWLQNIGLEWLFRFMQEPRCLWKRNLIGNTKFIIVSFKELFKKYLII